MLSTNSRSFRWLLVVACALALVDVQADDKPAQKLSGWQRLFRQHAAAYKVTVEGDGGGEAKLVPEPVLQWSQPVRGGADGAVFVWALEGRPMVIGTLFIWPMADGRQGVTHELHSLSRTGLVANWRDRRWTPPDDSIVWNAIPDAPVPAATPERRLRQMRDLARQFSAESHDKSDRRWDLRPLSSPIYRYGIDPKNESSPADGEVVDGALFGFVEGTDLEVVLSIQARYAAGSYHWEYAFSRMSDFRLIARHSDKSVWEVDRAGFDNPRVAYYCSTVESRTSPDDE